MATILLATKLLGGIEIGDDLWYSVIPTDLLATELLGNNRRG